MSSRVAILIGNGRSVDPLELQALEGPLHDVHDLAPVLRDSKRGGFHVLSLVDATTSETIDAIEAGLQQAGREGLFFLYFAGWGVLDRDDRLYLATADTRLATGQLLTIKVSDEFRQIRSKSGLAVGVLASSPRVQSP